MTLVASVLVNVGSFEWALVQLKKGHLVKRQSWSLKYCLKLNQSIDVIYDCYFDGIECVEINSYRPTVNDLMVNDWVVLTNESKK